MCEKLISKLVGRELSDINVLDVKPWVMHAEVAEAFLASNNRIILAGDAAHRFPPAGGFGMDFFMLLKLFPFSELLIKRQMLRFSIQNILVDTKNSTFSIMFFRNEHWDSGCS